MSRILVVDDELSIRSAIREFAEFAGYEVVEAKNGFEAVNICKSEDFDIIIMDIMMPKVDGFTAYKEIRKFKQIPALMLSAKGDEQDKLYGFEIGIEDYVVKPFSLNELMARVNVIISRNQNSNDNILKKNIIKYQGLEINISGRKVFVDGEKINLTPKEYDLLFFLAEHEDIVFSREDLLNKVWGYDFCGDDRTVDSHIKTLRRSLGEYRKFIITFRGAGYKFEAN